MPPDADKLRQRPNGGKTVVKTTAELQDTDASTVSTTGNNDLRTLQSLKTTEVCIDGIVYDIANFDHPGGDSIGVFGGNDVTVQYKMIHPYHTDKHLEKMPRVGKVVDYKTEYVVSCYCGVCSIMSERNVYRFFHSLTLSLSLSLYRFLFDTPFEREIKAEVFKIVRRGREFGTFGWFFRAIGYCALYAYLQYLWLVQGSSWTLAIGYGLAQSAIGMNVQHDANHGACGGKNRTWLNDVFGLGADFIGGSKWLWMEQHWTHHAYTNHPDMDPDAFGAEPMLLFNDYPLGDARRTALHHLQALYYLPVLAGYWLSSIFNPQVLDLRQRGALSVGMQMESDYIKSKRKYAIALRILYIYIHCIAPFQKTSGGWTFSWTILGHIMVLGIAESLGLAVLFSLSHNFEGSDRDPVAEARQTGQPVDWFKAQVETSCTYGGFISGCLTGGLNFQIEHHLFPRMSSAWYPYIAPTVRAVCKKHHVQYVYYPWVWQNFFSTVKYIHRAGTGANWMEKMKSTNPLSGNL
jgi:acyl-lipid (7-3)-desaturase (Delta-4 desaturase)